MSGASAGRSPGQIGAMGGINRGVLGQNGNPAGLPQPQVYGYTQGQNIPGIQGATATYAGGGNVTLPDGSTVPLSQYQMFGDNAAVDMAGIKSPQIYESSQTPGQWTAGSFNGNGQWQAQNPSNANLLAQAYGLNPAGLVNPGTSNPSNPNWNPTQYAAAPQTAAQGASAGMLGTGGMNTAATTSALAPGISNANTGTPTQGFGGSPYPQTGASSGYGGKGSSTGPSSGSSPYGGKGSSPYGGKGSSQMPTGTGGYTSSPYGAPNYGSSFLNPNTLPMGYGNSVSGWSSPSMTGDGFSWYGGQAPIPQGGMYNQMAQMMAGPSYSPAGSNWYSMAPGQTANFGPYGSTGYGAKGSSGGKGSSPYGYLNTPSPYQGLNSYADQYLGNTPQVYTPQASPTASSKGSTGLSPTQIGAMGGTNPYGTLGYNPQSLMMSRL